MLNCCRFPECAGISVKMGKPSFRNGKDWTDFRRCRFRHEKGGRIVRCINLLIGNPSFQNVRKRWLYLRWRGR